MFLHLFVLCGLVSVNVARPSDLMEMMCAEKCKWESADCGPCEASETPEEFSKPVVYCKAHNLLTFKMPDVGWNASYLVKIEERGVETRNVSVHGSNVFIFEGLKYSAEYRVKVWWTFVESKLISGPVVSDWVLTWEADHKPLPVITLEMGELRMQEDDGRYFATDVTWQPAEDLTCFYHLVIIGRENYVQMEMLEPGGNFSLQIIDLELDHDYSFGISGIDAWMTREGERTWSNITMPKCFNDNYCKPANPTGLILQESVLQEMKEGVLCDITVSWTKPDKTPDYYLIILVSMELQQNTSSFSANVTGDINHVKFRSVIVGLYYEVFITAYTMYGSSEEVFEQRSFNLIKQTKSNKITLLFVGMIAFFVLVLALMILCKYRSKLLIFSFNSKFAFNDLYTKDLWEINADDLHIEEILGEGAFGIVKRATLNRDGCEINVAVKTVKEYSQDFILKQFQEEIRIMKTVGQHPNIVSMIGYSHQTEKPLLIVEFCANGNLLAYLRSIWNDLMERGDEFEAPKMRSLLHLAKQVSEGMIHLGKMRMVHRDLAARNILICENGTAKVSDFGLSRDIYADDVYCQLGNGKVPLRWMALESITRFIYTSESDVWSFGIMLWEIVTLGGYPYLGLDNKEVVNFLVDGKRIDIPINCTSNLYKLMDHCWKTSPKDRPTFEDIGITLTNLIEEIDENLCIKL